MNTEIVEAEIVKEPVIGWVVLRCRRDDGMWFISIGSLTIAPWEADLLVEDGELGHRDEVIGVLPAQGGTFRVSGCVDGENYEVMGFEHPGSKHPDWVTEVKEQRARMASKDKSNAITKEVK